MCCLLACLTVSGRAVAEDESGLLEFPDSEPKVVNQAVFSTPETFQSGTGIEGRIGFIGLPAYGRNKSILPVELFPYIQSDNQILFGDFRGFIDTSGQVGGNAGVGYRFIEPNNVALFGINGFYDGDNSTRRYFQQLSVGWEARTRWLGAFGNIYMPVGPTNKQISQSISNPHFNANNILFDVTTLSGQAMTGLDLYFQAYLPGDFFEDHQVRATAGWYHFEGGKNVKPINGYKLQLQGNIIPEIMTQVAVMRDETFGTNVNVGISYRFGTRQAPDASLRGQLRRFVNRNYNVIVSQKATVDSDVAAINPTTGSAYVVQHVGTNSGTGTGTATDPYTSINAAQNAGADVIFVHSGTIVNDNVVLTNGQYLFGEGVSHQLTDTRYGQFYVPSATGGTQLAQIANSSGTAVTMANNSTISGFSILNPTGNAIIANGANNFNITNVEVKNAGADSITVSNAKNGRINNVSVTGGTGNALTIMNIDDVLSVNNFYVQDSLGDGVHIDGGRGTIAMTGDLFIKNVGGSAFSVQNMKKTTTVDTKGTPDPSDDVTTETPSIVSVNQLVVRGSTGSTGIQLADNEGMIGFGQVDIQTKNASALHVRDTAGLLIKNGYLESTNAPTVDAEDSAMNISLTSVKADGGAKGLRFVSTTGQFLVYGDGSTAGSGGSIKNTTVGVYMENADTVGLQTVDFTANGKVAEVHGGNVLSIAGSKVTGTTNMLVDAMNLTRLQFYQSTFTGNTLSSNTGILFQADKVGSYTAAVSNNTATAMPGTFFKAQTLSGAETSSLTYAFQQNQVELTTTGGVAAAMDWTGPVLTYVTNNHIVGSQSGQTAFQLFTGAGTDLGQIQASQNLIALSGTNSIGIDLNNQSPVNVVAHTNQIDFNGSNGIGIRASATKASALSIESNVITDFSGGATGILLTSLENQTQVALNSNMIDLSRASTFVDRGIIVSSITANDGSSNPLVYFVSSNSNTINGATTPYVFPSTGVRGQIIVNDTTIPLP